MAEDMPTHAAPAELAKAFGPAKIDNIELCKVFFLWMIVKEGDATDDQTAHCPQWTENLREDDGGRAMVENCSDRLEAVSYTHLRAHETDSYLVCRLLLEKKT